MLNPNGHRNHLLKYLPPFLPNLLFMKAMKNLEPINQRYKQIQKGPTLIPQHLIVSMKKKAEREKARPPKFTSSVVSKKKEEEVLVPSTETQATSLEEVKTIEVQSEDIPPKP